ncbi:MAG: permease [uncultured bacterium]|nr:MAG: permease [uncultured bacterium]
MDFKKIQSYTLITALVGITLLFAWMIRPYIYPIFWAGVLAALFYPLYKKILLRCHGKAGLAAGITEIIIVLIFLIPFIGIVLLIIQQAFSVYKDVAADDVLGQVTGYFDALKNWPILNRLISSVDVADLSQRLVSVSSAVTTWAYQLVAKGGQNTARWLFQLFIMLYTLYYFMQDGEKLLKRLMHLLPLGDRYELILYQRFVSTSRATLKGTLLIGLIQGTIATIAFLIADVPASIFWGMIMVMLAIIPGVGGSIVMIPAIVIMLLLGNYWQAAVIAVGLVISSTIDNFLRGPLVGKDAQMHPLFIFFSTLGGILAFGISGIVIGPVITAFLLSLWQIYEEKYKTQLETIG